MHRSARVGEGTTVGPNASIGPNVVIGPNCRIGASAVNHDLTGLKGNRLRTHGGTSETKVPFILNRPLNDAYKAKAASQPLKSWQLFDYAINGTL